MRYPKYMAMLFCSFALIGAPAFAQKKAQPHVVLKPAKERHQQSSGTYDSTMALTPGAGEDTDFARCVSDWDAATHMTKREWRSACRRARKDYPGSFGP